ncbi:MAG TPA: DUF4279 domain-containing protein [Verrucomicrobiae bacterium]
MPVIETSAVSLRISGDDLVPDEITALLGVPPTSSHIKGQLLVVSQKLGTTKIAKTGFWILDATKRKPENMNGQIHELLSPMTGDLAVWQSIIKKYRVDLFCGLFLGDSDGGMTLSPQSLKALGERGIELALCVYPGGE